MTHADVDPTTRNALHAARTYQDIPPEHYQVEWRSLAELITRRAAEQGDREFLAYFNDQAGESVRWSYAGLIGRAARIANLLVNEYGVRHGERVATLAYNHPDTVAIYAACWLIGATVAPQNVGEDDSRIAFILRNAEARVLLARPEYAARAATLQAEAANVLYVVALDSAFDDALAAQPAEFAPAVAPGPEDEALLVYTSGTTGAPKGVQLSHYNLLADCTGIMRWHGIDSATRMMCILPIHHVNGTVVTLITPML
ncbi:MAG TPA: class I adenylate-forming enzyme family protein, partial [Herpetosiphonaceae bacterium]|nr:class I adenylate-forming enzyme family protein [Herpetosiphonaceae bacterium]